MPLIIASIYVPPQKTICSELLNKILFFNNNFLILGDFNANHFQLDCKKTDKSGRVLLEWILEQSVSIIETNDATFESKNYSARLEWIFSDFETALDCNDYTTHPLFGTTFS